MISDVVPVEILEDILLTGLTPYDHAVDPWGGKAYAEQQSYLLSICLVSRYWMGVAYATPLLWTLVVIQQPPHPALRIASQLERARKAPLDIICYCVPFSDERDLVVWSLWRLMEGKAAQ